MTSTSTACPTFGLYRIDLMIKSAKLFVNTRSSRRGLKQRSNARGCSPQKHTHMVEDYTARVPQQML